jgi:hypothetical protein
MPTILVVGPYRLFFVSLDRGEPLHIHIQREKIVANSGLNLWHWNGQVDSNRKS